MLIGGRGIFGAIAFDAEPGDAEGLALEARARQSGMDVDVRRFHGALLGTVSRARRPSPRPPSETGPAGHPTVATVTVGDVFNRRELATELGAEHTSDDASIVSLAYETWGAKALARLNGAYAAAIWDAAQRKLVLTCDHRGDAHLYYRVRPRGIVFSSWLSLLPDAGTPVDRAAVTEFLRFLYIAPPRTIFAGIHRLPPGHALSGSAAGHTVEPFADSAAASVPSPGDAAADALCTFETLLTAAVRRRLDGRRVGIFMSGGVDSATLAAVCARSNPGGVRAFTVGFEAAALDESGTAGALAQHLEIPHEIVRFDLAHYRTALERMSTGFDQPFADPAGLALLLTCEHAQATVDVFTGGTGGDDLFASPLPRHLRRALALDRVLPGPIRRTLARALARAPVPALARRASTLDFGDAEEPFITWRGWSRRELEALFGQPVDLGATAFYRAFRAHRGRGPEALYDALEVFPPDDCRFEAAGLVGVPMHLPYHDPDLRAFVRGLPRHFHHGGTETKVLLRRLFERHFPRPLWGVEKHYFTLPLDALLRHAGHAVVREHLDGRQIADADLVPADRARGWVARYVAGDTRLMFKVWALVVLHAWWSRRPGRPS